MNVEEKKEQAKDPNTPIKILEELSKDSHYSIRCLVAKNPNTPVRILETLFKDESSCEREGS